MRIAIIQWILILLCLFTLAWIIYNAVTILVKQKKYKVIPLSNFYFLACLLILFRVAFQVVWWQFLLEFWTFFFLYGQTLKFLIGIQ